MLLERQNDAAVAAVEASARPPVLKAAPLSPKVAPVSTFPTARTEAWGRGGYDLVVAICNEVDVESKKLVNVLDLSNWGLHGFYGNRLRCKTSLYMPPPFLVQYSLIFWKESTLLKMSYIGACWTSQKPIASGHSVTGHPKSKVVHFEVFSL